MALFVFTAQQLADALQRRVNAGLQIRLIADPSFASRSFSEVLDLLGVALPDRNCKLEQDNQPFNEGLKGVGTPRLARGDKLHHKFAVIDNKTVITGSFNWSPSTAHTNDETLLVIHSPKLAAHFTREMNRMWRSAELGVTPRIQHKFDRQRSDAVMAWRDAENNRFGLRGGLKSAAIKGGRWRDLESKKGVRRKDLSESLK